jgi:cell division protein FtsX
LKDELTENSLETIEFVKDLQAVSSEIGVKFNSKDQVLANLEQRDAALVEILERDNPLPPTIDINGINLEDYEAINDIISNRAVLLLENNGNKDDVLAGVAADSNT